MNLAVLAKEKVRAFAAGESIFYEGDAADEMYVVLEGVVEILVNDRVVETAEKGTLFGEMALIDKSPRSGQAVAASACRLACIDQRRFLALVQQTPLFSLDVMRTLVDRLRSRTNPPRWS